jgi:VWFA-related protein
MTPENAGYAQTAVAEFLRAGLEPGDTVTLLGTGSSVWRSVQMPEGLGELLDAVEGMEGKHRPPEALREYVSDWEAMRIYVHEDRRIADRVERRFAGHGFLDPEELEERLDPDFYESQRQFIQTINPLVKARAAETYRLAKARTQAVLGSLERAIQAQTLEKGRKSLIFVSQGFINDTETLEIKDVRQAARRANVALYFVDARGLKALPAMFSAERRFVGDTRSSFTELQDVGANIFTMKLDAAGSQTLAAETGGFSINDTNDLAAGIRRIGDESRSYYLLGYVPSNSARDGKYRKIEVKVRGEGLTVRARKGYYAPDEDETERAWTADQEVQRALDAAHPLPDIPLRMTAYVLEEAPAEKARVVVAADVDIRALDFEEVDGRFTDTLEYLLAVVHRDTNEYFRVDEKADMKLLPETRGKLAVTWYPIVRDFELPPGPYRAKIVVRDQASGQLGTVTHDFEVEGRDRWRVTTPILSETVDRGEDGQSRPRAVPSARRVYVPGEPLYLEFQVIGAARDPSTGLPRVASGHSLQDGRGATLFVAEPTPIRPSSTGTVSRLIGLATAGLAPGDYALTLFLQDRVSGEMMEVLEPFRLAPSAGPPPAASNGG